MNTVKTVLISTASLPHDGVASWTTELNYLLKRENELDYVVGPHSNIKIDKPIQISINEISFLDKVKRKFNYKNRFNPYLRGLKKVLKLEDKIILQVKDNYGLLKAVLAFVKKSQLRKRVYIQYHYHSFMPFSDEAFLLEQIDELVLLTEESYQKIKKETNTLPIRISINNDGVDSNLFKPVDKKKKQGLRKSLSLSSEKLIFIWTSQDRKKKGLDVILETWERIYSENQNIELLVFGLNKNIDVNGVKNMGQVPNSSLVNYYQSSDFFLFPTLCQEGFGLSLVEALKSGSYCIAADNGSTPYILNNGQYGKLVDRPNMVNDWVRVIKSSILEYEANDRENIFLERLPKNIYDMSDWCFRYNEIIKSAKKSFKHRYYI
jgi:L-malate glycosyltransferase